MRASNRTATRNPSGIRAESDNGCSIYSDEKWSGGLSAAGAHQGRLEADPSPIVDLSRSIVNPADLGPWPTWPAPATNHRHIDNVSEFDRLPDEEEPVLFVIDWVIFAWFVALVIAWRWFLGGGQ